jgi:hypothetical protein
MKEYTVSFLFYGTGNGGLDCLTKNATIRRDTLFDRVNLFLRVCVCMCVYTGYIALNQDFI